MKKRNIQFLMLFLFSLFTGSILAQQIVTGVVSDDLGDVLPGVTVLEKGTSNGTVTDFDGKFVIKVSGTESILVFSYVGMQTKERNVGSQSNLSVVLVASAESLDEVVVTALGISREKRSLGYSVAEVKGDELRVVPQENALNALSGRVTGVQISNTGGAGSTVKVIIRGASSLTTDNQPLYVVDGVPIVSKLNNLGSTGSGVNVDYGSAISDLNPDDIENITVLKGPSAAALYGSRAGNGVVLITTRSGSGSKGFGVSFSSSSVFEQPYKFIDIGNRFANGYRVDPSITQIDETSAGGVGPELDKGNYAIQWPYTDQELTSGIPISRPLTSRGKDNAKNFFEMATTFINSVSIYNSTDKLDYRLGYSNMQHEGFVPNSDLHKNNISLNSSYKITDKIKISSVN
jgi:TonB-dependent SusC/RagA subfamily outer membrane receptor